MRVISLLAGATEMIVALGCLDQLVGRSHECDFPAEVQHLPLVSTVQIDTTTSSAEIDAQIKQLAHAQALAQDPSMRALSIYKIDEVLLQQLQPDIVFTQTQCEVCAVSEQDVALALARITGRQPRVVSLAPYRLTDVWEDLLRVGKALGRLPQAEALNRGYQQRLAHLRSVTAQLETQDRPRVTVLEWLDPLMAAGNWTPELVEYAGADAVFGTAGEHSPWLTWADLQAADPDVLILSPCGFTLARTLEELPLLQQQTGWQELRAVRQGRVYVIDGNYYLNRSGPRLVDSAELLGRVIWGEQVGIAVDEHAWRRVG